MYIGINSAVSTRAGSGQNRIRNLTWPDAIFGGPEITHNSNIFLTFKEIFAWLDLTNMAYIYCFLEKNLDPKPDPALVNTDH